MLHINKAFQLEIYILILLSTYYLCLLLFLYYEVFNKKVDRKKILYKDDYYKLTLIIKFINQVESLKVMIIINHLNLILNQLLKIIFYINFKIAWNNWKFFIKSWSIIIFIHLLIHFLTVKKFLGFILVFYLWVFRSWYIVFIFFLKILFYFFNLLLLFLLIFYWLDLLAYFELMIFWKFCWFLILF